MYARIYLWQSTLPNLSTARIPREQMDIIARSDYGAVHFVAARFHFQ